MYRIKFSLYLHRFFLLVFLSLIATGNSVFAQVVINEVMFDVPSGTAGDANGDGTRSSRGDEFIELVNTGSSSVNIGNWKFLQKDLDTVFTFPSNVVLAPGEFCVVFGGVDSSGFGSQFPGSLKIFASQSGANNGFAGGGRSNYSNAGDNVILRNASNADIAEVYWGSATAKTSVGIKLDAPNTLDGSSISGSIKQSVTRQPDKTGLWAKHSTVGNNANYTPGAFNNGDFGSGGGGNQFPTANANGPYSGIVLDAISFSSAGSNDPDGSIANYLWDFGDGQTSTQANPTHVYSAASNYTVSLTVTDNSGDIDTDSTTANITDPGNPNLVTLTFDDFESGFGNYTDGGSDASLYTGGTNAHQGNNAANIQDNSGQSSSFFHTNGIDAQPYSEIQIDFWFYAVSMENGEDFFVQFFDGSSWQTVASFARGSDFQNNTFVNETVTVNRSQYNFPSDMKIRFMCDASGNSDDVYIDEVRVSGVPAVTYTLGIATQGQGSISLDPTGGVYTGGSTVSLTASPAAGWAFSAWIGDLSGSDNPATITMDADKNVSAVFSELPPDNDAPTPDPMGWVSFPNATSNSSITMTAATAVDISGVEYYFEETTGNSGGSDSGWQDSPGYTDTGLNAATQYTYRVRARDKSANQNVTGWSSSQSSTTLDTEPGIDQEGPMMTLAGNHTFTATGSGLGTISWSVDRLTKNESGGSTTRDNNVFSATGANATFNLNKVSGKETIYEITAADSGFSETISVQVFPSNVRSSFMYESPGNPDVRVYIIVPASLSANSHLVSVHHGTSRNADDYILNWDNWGPQSNYIVIAPMFPTSDWPGSRSYNLGNMFSGNDGAGSLRPESEWSFTIARDVALKVLGEFGLNDTEYDAWGHSAGGQFVHRMLIFRPDAPIRIALPANPGWWTEPSLTIDYPYGLDHPSLNYTQQDILDWTNHPMIILRGENDTGSSGLRTTPEANAQGANRFERAAYMFSRGNAVNPNNSWELHTINNCGHDRNCMAPPGQDYLDQNPPN